MAGTSHSNDNGKGIDKTNDIDNRKITIVPLATTVARTNTIGKILHLHHKVGSGSNGNDDSND